MLFLIVRFLQFDGFVAPATGLRAAAAQAADAARTNSTEDILEVDKLLSAGTKRIRFSRIFQLTRTLHARKDALWFLYFVLSLSFFAYETRSL